MGPKERDVMLAEKEWKKERDLQERKFKLKKEKRELRSSYAMKPSTTKLLILFLFINCTLIEFFTGWVTIKSLDIAQYTLCSPDFTPLVTLIGAVVSEVIGFAVYALKSIKENTSGGIIFESAMKDIPPLDTPIEDDLQIENSSSDEAAG